MNFLSVKHTFRLIKRTPKHSLNNMSTNGDIHAFLFIYLFNVNVYLKRILNPNPLTYEREMSQFVYLYSCAGQVGMTKSPLHLSTSTNGPNWCQLHAQFI